MYNFHSSFSISHITNQYLDIIHTGGPIPQSRSMKGEELS
jgi:hypothetical protein